MLALVAVVSGSLFEMQREEGLDAGFALGRELQESGSGSPPPSAPPPPPSPLSPPGAPGATTRTVYKSVVTMIAAGAVEDYTQDKRDGIAAAFANASGVNASQVTVVITSGSVVIQTSIEFTGADAEAQAQATETSLSTTLATPEAASSFFIAADPTLVITVESAPVVVAVTENVVSYPPMPPPPPIPMAQSGDDSMDGGAIAGAVIGSLIGAALIVGGIMFAMKGGMPGSSGKEPAGVTFTSVNPNQQENV